MYPVSCTGTHHDVTDLVNHWMVKNVKESIISREQNKIFYATKNFLTRGSGGTY